MTRRRSLGRLVRRALLGALALLTLFLAGTATGRYLVRAGWEEARILLRRRPIAELVADPAVDAATRARLRLVLRARGFAADSLRLAVRESFSTFTQLDRDTLVLVLAAAYRDELKRRTWWFPVVGRVPYKGFFDFEAARDAAAAHEREGWDVYLRPAAAFSTLGWFNDPLLSTTLRQDSLDLVDTVIHELVHNTFYASGQAVFNESFANFVGARGAAWFFRVHGAPLAAAEMDRRWENERLLGAFWTRVHGALDSAFTLHAGDRAARLRARDTIYARARRELVETVGPRLHGMSPARLARTRLDNAVLLARRIYLTDLQLFDAVYAREGRDLRRTVARVMALARSEDDDPYGALRAWLGPDTLPADTLLPADPAASPATAPLPAEAAAQQRP